MQIPGTRLRVIQCLNPKTNFNIEYSKHEDKTHVLDFGHSILGFKICLIAICVQVGDRGGSEEPHPQAGTRAYYKYVEESDAATTKVYT
jgi:hypothetical protein